MVAVCVSSVPGSLMVPVSVATPFSSMAGTLFNTTTGATLFTVTVAVLVPTPPSSSKTVTVMV